MIELILPPQPKRSIDGINAYKLYLTLKTHFQGRRDLIKYRWVPINCSQQAFNKCNTRYFFERMSTKYTLGDLASIMIVNFAANPDAWGGEIASADAVSFYRSASTRLERPTEMFKEDVTAMLHFGKTKGIKFKDLIYSTSGQPWIFKFLQQRVVHYETMLLLDCLFGFIDKYDDLKDHVWANGYAQRIKAYRALCRINREQAKACFTEIVQDFKKYSK